MYCLLWEIGLVDWWFECVCMRLIVLLICLVPLHILFAIFCPWNPHKSLDFYGILADFTSGILWNQWDFRLNPQYLNLNFQYFTLRLFKLLCCLPFLLGQRRKVISGREFDIALICILFSETINCLYIHCTLSINLRFGFACVLSLSFKYCVKFLNTQYVYQWNPCAILGFLWYFVDFTLVYCEICEYSAKSSISWLKSIDALLDLPW